MISDWMTIDQWQRCVEMAKPGIIFEIRNADGQSLFTPCTSTLPAVPFDWKTPATAFRAVDEPAPLRSGPLPPPRG
jgi:hypothetical protein